MRVVNGSEKSPQKPVLQLAGKSVNTKLSYIRTLDEHHHLTVD